MTARSYACPLAAITALFVEGGDEVRLCQRILGSAPIFYRPLDGRSRERVGDRIRVAMNDPSWPNIRHVGVLLDMEEAPAEAFALAEFAFQTLGRPFPPNAGALNEISGQRSGFYLLPDNHSRGSVESLLRTAAAPGEAGCVDAFFTCTPNPGTTTAQRDKAWVSAYASARTGNGRLDQLFGDKPVFDVGHRALDPLRAFLESLALS